MAGMSVDPSHGHDPATRWDAMTRLPGRNWFSAVLVMFAAGLNAFNDNVLKMVIIGLVPKVAEGPVSQNIGAILGAIILLPYLLFAPVAGYLSDRFSKRVVIMAMLVAQALILLMAAGALESALGHASVTLAIITFFLLALDTTVLSPAKSGIMKEIVGSRRLGMLAGWLQMVTVVSMLAGIYVGGEWFDHLYAQHGDAWSAAARPVWVLLIVAVMAVIVCRLIQRTPAHPQVRFQQSLIWEHYEHLRETLREREMRRACLGNAAYWFVATMTMAMVVDIGLALHPGMKSGGAASATAHMTLMLGGGTAAGAVFVSWLNRGGLQPRVIPLGALGMALALVWAGLAQPGTRDFHAALAAVGFTGGCYMVPIHALIQDLAHPTRRGRVLSAANLMDSIAGIVSVVLMLTLKAAGMGFRWQFWVLAALILAAAVHVSRLISAETLRALCLALVRAVYNVRGLHTGRVPKTGGLLVLPNHVSYADAMVISAACPRPLRFVIWDVLYEMKWSRWFLDIFDTVPIAPTRAKEAVRTVGDALRKGDAVCLFPEGQITRTGMVNGLQKGFELMARHGDAPVLPVFLDGMYGSMFSYRGGYFFKKWPRHVRYPAQVYFGEPIPRGQANRARLREALLALGSEAFLARPLFDIYHHRALAMAGGSRKTGVQCLANAMRLGEVELLKKGDAVFTTFAKGGAEQVTIALLPSAREDVHYLESADQIKACAERSVIAVCGRAEEATALMAMSDAKRAVRLVLIWGDLAGVSLPALEVPVLRGYFDARSGALLAQNIPDPVMSREDNVQRGSDTASLGRLLPGLAAIQNEEGLVLSGLSPGADTRIVMRTHQLCESGFITRQS
jgi:acyl-[acyl-carrier-protein]-phospholipid O-acyltransferase/long-chain-fatty-acid--[acyl-carrier-protein] ligase